uniref:Cell division protein n=1 Tax=Closterium baillyanum TaxID=1416941 RepID=A0A191T5S1_9VIRI|nr:cell division protein [Closterium baillyanum]ANI25739.1 cell division protein [Closterium baillyanum]
MQPSKQISNNAITFIDAKTQSPTIMTNVLAWYYYLFNNIFILLHFINYKIQTLIFKLQRFSLLQNHELHKIANMFSKCDSPNGTIGVAWLKKRIYSEKKFVYFFNIPYTTSIFLLGIFESFKKKTIFLYQTILILTLPILIYRVHNQVYIGTGSHALESIILGKEPSLSLQNRLSQKRKSTTKWLYVHKIHEGIEGKILDNHLLETIDFKNRIKTPSFFKNIESEIYEKSLNNHSISIPQRDHRQHTNSTDTKKKQKKNRQREISFTKKYLDNHRLVDMWKNINLSQTLFTSNVQTIFNDEWKVLDTSLKKKPGFHIHSPFPEGTTIGTIGIGNTIDLSKEENSENNVYQRKPVINITSLLDNCYILLIKPNQLNSLNVYNSEKRILESSLYKNKDIQYTEISNTKDIYKNTRKDTFSHNGITNNQEHTQSSLTNKYNGHLNFLKNLMSLNKIHIRKDIKEEIQKISLWDHRHLYLITFYKNQLKFLTQIPRWLSEREEESIQAQNVSKWNQIPFYNRTYKKKLFILLDSQRKKWRYKTIEQINIYNQKTKIESNREDPNYFDHTCSQKRNFKALLNCYWIYNKRNFVNPLMNFTTFYNLNQISKEPLFLDKNITNKSCWDSLNYELTKNKATIEISNINEENLGYFPCQMRNRYYFQGSDIAKKHDLIADGPFGKNINILSLLKQLHFAPVEQFIQPFVNTKTQQRFEVSRILYSHILESTYHCSSGNPEIKSGHNRNSRIHTLSSKIQETLWKSFVLQKKKEHETFFDIIKYLSKLIVKSGQNSVLSNKHSLSLFSNIHVQKDYAKAIHVYTKETEEKKSHIQYPYLQLGKISGNQIDKIVENRGNSFVNFKNNEVNLLDFSKIWKNTNDPLLWLPISLIEKSHIDTQIADGPFGNTANTTNGIFLFPEDRYEAASNTMPSFNTTPLVSREIRKRREKLDNTNQFHKSTILNKYNKWIFTPQWWRFRKQIIINQIPVITQNVDDNRQTLLRPIIQHILVGYQNSLQELHNQISLHYNKNILHRLHTWNKCLTEETYRSTRPSVRIWNTVEFYKSLHATEWVILGWFATLCIVYYHWVPMFMGTTYINAWYKFEKMRSFSRPSWNTFVHILVHNSIDSPSQQLRLTMYASRGWIIWFQSKILSYLLGKTFLSNLLLHTTSIDLPRSKKNLVVSSLITEKTLLSKYNLWNFKKNIDRKYLSMSESSKYEGIAYFKKWSHTSYRNPKLMQYKKSVSTQFQWLTDLFFHINSSPYTLQSQSTTFALLDPEKIPRNLPEPTLSTKRWLLLGAPETGKSYLVKNIAADTHFPLVHVSLKDIRHATPDFKYNQVKKHNKWIKQLADRGFFLENILELAKMLAPCILWISDLHEFHTKDNIYNQQGKIYDASFLLTILLKIMGNDLLPERQSNITLVGSSHSPGLLDPKFVSRHRLDLIVNLRKPSFFQRQKIFANFLNSNNLNVKGRRSFYELGSNTIGYTLRDIAGLVNEILLIKTTNSTKIVDTNIIRLAVYRQISKQSANNAILEREAIQYKIGRAIVQTTLVSPKAVFPLTIRHDLAKSRFYYLSNAFLEIEKSTVTELTILTHIVNCLAGTAARDAWILSTRKFDTVTLAITKELKHDLSIASSILQSLLLEFPMRDISCVSNDQKYDLLSHFRGKYNVSILKKATFSLNLFNRFTSYIYWSYRIQRLSLSWTLLFDNIKKSRKNMVLESSSDDMSMVPMGKEHTYHKLEEELDSHLPYQRRATKRQQKRVTKMHSSFNEMVWEYNLKTMGLPWISEYVMDYDALQSSILLLEARPIWNPPSLTPAYSILFFDRDLVISRNMLTKVYLTYGEKFQTEKLNPKRIKKQVLWPDASIQNSNVNADSPFGKKSAKQEERLELHLQDFNYFRKMAKANAQLEQSQLQAPVYLYQGWIGPDHQQSWRSSDLLNHRERLINENLRSKELLIYGTLLEIYHCLLKFFITNQSLINNIEHFLIKDGVLNREDIERAVKNTQLL